MLYKILEAAGPLQRELETHRELHLFLTRDTKRLEQRAPNKMFTIKQKV